MRAPTPTLTPTHTSSPAPPTTSLVDAELVNMLYISIQDESTSAQGGMNGIFSEMTSFNGVQETVPDVLKRYEEWGGPTTYPHMAAGWAVTGDAPSTGTKQVASNFGGNSADASSFSKASACSAYRWASCGILAVSSPSAVSMYGKDARGSASRARSKNGSASSGF